MFLDGSNLASKVCVSSNNKTFGELNVFHLMTDILAAELVLANHFISLQVCELHGRASVSCPNFCDGALAAASDGQNGIHVVRRLLERLFLNSVDAVCCCVSGLNPLVLGQRLAADNSRMTDRLKLYLDLIRWSRPAGWLLLLWPTLSALWLAADGFPGWHLVAVFTLGTILMRSAGCCVNDVADREFDKHVKRTALRPVTSGRLGVKEALGMGGVLALLAFMLVLSTNRVTVAWSFAALAVTLVYPYAKRWVAMPQAVLGVAFSFGIPMAFAAVQSEVPPLAWGLLLGNLFWVLAYDTEYAMVDRDDDLKIGMKTSAITLGRWDVTAITGFYAAFLTIWALLLNAPERGAWLWWGLAGAGLQALWHVWLIKDRSREGCFKAFRLNHWVGLSVFAGLALSYT
jgi:4-hydroxybenzoate polyprenyltransferase